jgi:hypothetical protein
MREAVTDAEQVKLWRVVLKALLLFVIFNLAFAGLAAGQLGRFSVYNVLLPGRERFPFGEEPERAYNLSLYNLDAMFASHVVSAPPQQDELRVFVLGDSSIWGTLLLPEQTLSGQLNASRMVCGIRPVQFYNLGYPTLSLAKDLMLLEEAMQYKPDLVIWLVTLESFPVDHQLDSPIAANNPQRIEDVQVKYGLELGADSLPRPSFLERTIIGQRRVLADLARLQLYGVLWAATGIDQYYPEDYRPAQRDLEPDAHYYSFAAPGDLKPQDLAFDLLNAGQRMAGDIPLLLVNEPILISSGENSDIRYNYYYPRWTYDAYRQMLDENNAVFGIDYLDLWNRVPESQFTNTAIHTSPAGTKMVAESILSHLNSRYCEEIK